MGGGGVANVAGVRMAGEIAIESTDEPGEAERQALFEGLRAENDRRLGPAGFRRLAVFARAEEGLCGGLIGETARGFLCVEMLWVAPHARGVGLGSTLLRRAETEAARRGCRHAWLDTYSFQARPFYERHGYRAFGELAGYAHGASRFFMTKRLDPAG